MAHCKALAGTRTIVAPPSNSPHCSVHDCSQHGILKTSFASYPNTLCLLRSCSKSSPSASSQLQWGSSEHRHGQTQALNCTYQQLLTRSRSGGSISCLQSSNESGGVDEERGGGNGGEEEEGSRFDVSSNCVKPVFRVSPFLPQASDVENKKARILFLSEGNVCRSIFAEAIFNSLIEEHGLQEFVECTSKASRDYNVGESPDSRAVEVAQELGLKLREGASSRVFDCSSDIVLSDLLVVMDKFNASDVLKEVTVYEAIDKEGRYSYKVRRLSEFCRTKLIEDIDDPLYGNMGGPEELELLREVYKDLRDSCEGLIQTLIEIKAGLQGSETLKQGIAKSLGEMESLDWLVPPMLQRAETLFT